MPSRRIPLRRRAAFLALPAMLLACAGCGRGLEGYVADLSSPDPYRRELAVLALSHPDVAAQDQGAALRALLEARHDTDQDIAVLADRGLVHAARRAAPEVCGMLCEEPDEGLARALLAGGAECAPHVREALTTRECPNAVMLARLLGAMGPEALPEVLRLVDESSVQRTRYALIALHVMGPRASSARPVVEGLARREDKLGSEARAVLERME